MTISGNSNDDGGDIDCNLSLFPPLRALLRSVQWTPTSTSPWAVSTVSEASLPSRSLGPIRTSLMITKVRLVAGPFPNFKGRLRYDIIKQTASSSGSIPTTCRAAKWHIQYYDVILTLPLTWTRVVFIRARNGKHF